jgi:fructokinase
VKKYQISGSVAALVDTEVVVTYSFMQKDGTEKVVLTLVDEARQAELFNAFSAYKHPH